MAKTTSVERGIFLLTLSKFFAVVTGFVIYFGLARILGPEKFGIYGVVVGIVSVFNMLVIRGTLHSVSKFVSENPEKGEAIKRASLKMAAYLGIGIFFVYEFGAGLLASLLNDMTLVPYIRVAGFIILGYTFYAVFLGFVNGMRQFSKQASFEIIYNILKTVLVLALALLGFSVMGALIGFAAAAILIAVVSIIVVGWPKPKGEVDREINTKALWHFNIAVMGIAFLQNLLMQLDLFAVKALSPVAISNLLGGYYTAVLSIARIPYYTVISLSFVIFPLISHSTFSKNKERTARYINEVMRYSLIILVGLVVLISADAKGVLSLLYSSAYAAGAPALSIAAFALLAYALFYVALIIITAAGRPRHSLYLALAVLVIDLVANYFLVPKFQLVGAAVASTLAFFFGLAITAVYLVKEFGAFVPWLSLLRVSLVGLVVYWISSNLSYGFPLWVVKMAILGGLYLGLLVVTREFTSADFQRVFRIVKG